MARLQIYRQYRRRFIGIVVLLSMTAACSLKTFYNQLDYLIPSYVEGMVTLDEMLADKVEQRTQVLINWHRNTQLKQYAELLRSFQRDFSPQLSEARVLQHISAMESLWQPLQSRLNEEMASLLPLLSAAQREQLFLSIDEKNEDFHDEYVDLDTDERIEEFTDSLRDNYESWLGDLSDQQEKFVEQAASRFQSSAALRLQQRKNWQAGIHKILDSAADGELKTERLRAFFEQFNAEPNFALAAADRDNRQVVAWLTVKLVHTSSAQQKEHFFSKTDDYIRIFTELAENR